MKNIEPRHYDVIVAPVVTEKATMASEHNKVLFKVAAKATKPQIKEARPRCSAAITVRSRTPSARS